MLAGNVSSSCDPSTGDERLDYTHRGLAEVQISGGGRAPLTLLIADDSTAGSFWRQNTRAGAVLERGPELVRTAGFSGGTLTLRGDTSSPGDLEVWAPPRIHEVTWNRLPVRVRMTAAGSLSTVAQLPGPQPVRLPDLIDGTWRYAPESPEANPGFDDSSWRSADQTETNSTSKRPAGQPALTADAYGFHHGDVWYRGHYTTTTATAQTALRYGGGGAGMLQAWLDGHRRSRPRPCKQRRPVSASAPAGTYPAIPTGGGASLATRAEPDPRHGVVPHDVPPARPPGRHAARQRAGRDRRSTALTVARSKLDGPGDVTFSAPTAPSTEATFSQPGVYLLRLQADNGHLSTQADTTITVVPT